NEGDYVSLGHDALAPVVAQQAEEASRRTFGWNKMLDALWITIPLLILLGVFTLTRMNAIGRLNEQLADLKKDAEKKLKEAGEENKFLVERSSGLLWPGYVGNIRQGHEAYLAGDLVRARQALQLVKPLRALDPDDVVNDVRGFEWYYVWGLLNQ